MPRPSLLFPLLVIIGVALTGWGCGTGDDDDFGNSGGDDDVDAPASISGTMLQPVDSAYTIEEGTLLEVRAYLTGQWDDGADFPIASGDYSGATQLAAAGTWPMVFTIPLEETGTYYIWAFADADEDGEVSGEVYGLGQANPINMTGSLTHVSGELILFDQFFEGSAGDDDTAGDDDSAG